MAETVRVAPTEVPNEPPNHKGPNLARKVSGGSAGKKDRPPLPNGTGNKG